MENKLSIHVKLSKTIFANDSYQVVVFNAISNDKNKRTFIAVGNFPRLTKNEELLITGDFTKNRNGKEQFKVESWKRPTPSTKEQLISFFSSVLFQGVGKKTATNIYNTLGDEAIVEINNKGITALEKVEGLSKAKAAEIALITQETFLLNDIIEQYQKYGIRSEVILKAHSKLANRVIELKESPYLLAFHNLIHFHTADEIGKQMDILPHAKIRQETVLYLYLKEVNKMQKHCYIEEKETIQKCLEVLNRQAVDERDLVHENSFIAMTEESKYCYIEQGRVYPSHLYYAEKDVAEKIYQLTLSVNQYKNVNVEKAICTFEKEHKTTLSSEQRQAIHRLIKENLLFLTGGPGTGKTFTVNAILKVYKALFPQHQVALAAPTGRAAKRLGEVTGMGSHAQTIHRLLGIGYNGMDRPQYNRGNPLESTFIIIDEFSMVDIELAKHLFNAIQEGAKVLIVGDADQLPSIGAGNVLKDCLEAKLPQIHLTKIFRQAQGSAVIQNAHKINSGQMISLENEKDQYYFIESNHSKRSTELVAHSVKKLLSQGAHLNDIMVLSPMKNGDAGIYKLNERIQELINPKEEKKKEVEYKGITYRVGDKIMYLINNREKDIYNGDVGIIKDINRSKSTITIDFDGNVVDLEKDHWKDIQPAFSMTIHKSQGNQAKYVIMCLTDQHKLMLTRNLFYTGITRTEKMTILIGTKEAIETAVTTNRVHTRKTSLKEKILHQRSYINKYQSSKIG